MCQSKPASSSRRLYTEGNLTLLPHLTHISTSNKEPSHPGSFDQDILGTLSFKKPVIATMNPWLEVVVCPVFILLCVSVCVCVFLQMALTSYRNRVKCKQRQRKSDKYLGRGQVLIISGVILSLDLPSPHHHLQYILTTEWLTWLQANWRDSG